MGKKPDDANSILLKHGADALREAIDASHARPDNKVEPANDDEGPAHVPQDGEIVGGTVEVKADAGTPLKPTMPAAPSLLLWYDEAPRKRPRVSLKTPCRRKALR